MSVPTPQGPRREPPGPSPPSPQGAGQQRPEEPASLRPGRPPAGVEALRVSVCAGSPVCPLPTPCPHTQVSPTASSGLRFSQVLSLLRRMLPSGPVHLLVPSPRSRPRPRAGLGSDVPVVSGAAPSGQGGGSADHPSALRIPWSEVPAEEDDPLRSQPLPASSPAAQCLLSPQLKPVFPHANEVHAKWPVCQVYPNAWATASTTVSGGVEGEQA